ncbi:MAG: acyltransferase [Asticcacaulis sp.]|uniref:acyltransferase family protein n=1 Tax=Asticcacaulis sp. TaxID=1872648 RepID=UPI0039E3A57F
MKPLTFALFRTPHAPDAQPRAGGASLDVLRFMAASFILLFHYGSTAPVDLATLLPVFRQGWLATDFFLLLSGYILSRAYGQRLVTSHMRRTHFFLRRFARLWPSHILVLLVFGAFVLASSVAGFAPNHAEKYGAADFIAQAFLVHGWGIMRAESWNTPTWTLSALLICYGLFSVYVPFVYKRSLPVMIGLSLAVLLIAHGLALGLAHHPLVDLPFAWALLRAIPLFLLGNLIERMTAGLRVSKPVFWGSLALAFIAISGLSLLPRHALTDSLILSLLGLVLAVSGGVTFHENLVTHRMGRASFALFLTHSLVGAIWFGLSPRIMAHFNLGVMAQWSLWIAGVLVAIVTAFLFDALIDKPLSQRISRLSFVKGGI